MQNVVEKLHFCKRVESKALCNTVADAWKKLDSIKLQNVYNRWLMVLDLIIDNNSNNALVETKRGKLYRDPSAEMEMFDDKDDNADNIDAETLDASNHTDE